MQLLKQSTASTVYVGPVLDSAGAAVTTAALGDFRLVKNGTAATLTGATVTHDANGYYTVALTTTNTDTTGRLTLAVGNTAMSMSTHRFSVLLASVYDALITNATNATGGLPTATGAIAGLAGTIATTTNITAATGVVLSGVTHTGAVIPTVSTVTNGVTVTTNNDKTGYTASTVSDKTGYSLLATTGLGNQTANITGNLSGSVGSVTGAVGSVTAAVAVSDKTGFKLASDGLALVTAWTVGITGNITGNLSGSVGSVTGLTASNLDAAVSSRLAPTVSGRTLDVTATGAAGIDWGNVENQSASVGLSDTYMNNVTSVDQTDLVIQLAAGALGPGAIDTDIKNAVWNGLPSSGYTNGSFGDRILISTSDQREVAITGSNHVAADIHELQPAVITAADFATGAIDANALAADAATEIATAVAATQALSRLDSMIESDGAGQFRFDTIALSMGAGGAGGTDWTANERTAIRSILGFDSSGTVSLPTVGVMDAVKDKTDLITSGSISVIEDRVNNDTITMQYNESTTATVNLDENTTSATLQFVVSRPDGTDILTIPNGSITRTSTSFTVTITTAVTATLGQYLWSLRDITGASNRVITKGVLTVQNAASA
jgi:hypothetical protein